MFKPCGMFRLSFSSLRLRRVFTISGNEKALLERVFVMKRAYPPKAHADNLIRKYHIKKRHKKHKF